MNRTTSFVLFVAALISLCLLLMATLRARELARMMSCSNNFKQLGLAVYNYHSAFNQLPMGCGGTGPTPGQDDWSNQRRLSGLVALVPFIEASAMWEQISNPYVTGDMPSPPIGEELPNVKGNPYFRDFLDALSIAEGPLIDEKGNHYFPAMGPAPWLAKVYPLWQLGMITMRCPSDSTERPPKHAALLNYGMCYGDGIHAVGYPPGALLDFRGATADQLSQRGAFVSGKAHRFRDCTDGLAVTVFMAEIVTWDGSRRASGSIASGMANLKDNPASCLNAIAPDKSYKTQIRMRLTPDGKASRGGNWADGAICWSGFNTILPPNSPNCDTESEQRLEGVFSASSMHAGGCHALMGDGAIKFISETIDTGNLHRASVYTGAQPTASFASPYGIWGAMGTIASESIESIE